MVVEAFGVLLSFGRGARLEPALRRGEAPPHFGASPPSAPITPSLAGRRGQRGNRMAERGEGGGGGSSQERGEPERGASSPQRRQGQRKEEKGEDIYHYRGKGGQCTFQTGQLDWTASPPLQGGTMRPPPLRGGALARERLAEGGRPLKLQGKVRSAQARTRHARARSRSMAGWVATSPLSPSWVSPPFSS